MKTRASFTLFLVVAACTGEDSLARLHPRIAVSPVELSFGSVPVLATKYLSLEITNPGSHALTVGMVSIAPPFHVAFAEPLVIAPGLTRTLEVAYRPSEVAPSTGALSLMSDAEDTPSVSIALSGTGAPSIADVRPERVDWDGTTVGTGRSLRLVVTNRGEADLSGTLAAFDFARPEHFTLGGLESLTSSGRVLVPGGGSTSHAFSYFPLAAGADSGRVLFELCGDKCGLEIATFASATLSSVRLEPQLVDFGAIGIHGTGHASIFVRNEGTLPAQLTSVKTRKSADVAIVLAPSLPASISPGASAEIRVDYTPPSASALDAELVFELADADAGELRVPLIGRGEGPLFEVFPEALDFGMSSRGGGRRTVLLENEGSSDVRVLGLELGGDPAFSLIGRPPLPATLGQGESLLVSVGFDAVALGMYQGTLAVRSDDEQSPRVEVSLAATLADLPCELQVTPERVDFGVAGGSARRTETAVVKNRSLESCTLTGGRFDADPTGVFSAVAVAFPVVLQPEGELTLEFGYAPREEGVSYGEYVLTTDAPDAPEHRISVSGVNGQICDGRTTPCVCSAEKVRTYRRFDRPDAVSSISPGSSTDVFHQYCFPATATCGSDHVQVEIELDRYACVLPPTETCLVGTQLDYVDGALTCAPCDVVIQFGSLYAGERWCAEVPKLDCPPGQVPTFLYDLKRWECAQACDNSTYDAYMLDGYVVCIPC